MSSNFDIPRFQKISPELSKIFGNVRGARRHVARREAEELRASNLPVCPRAYVIYRRLPLIKRPRYEETFISDSATLMGTALHLALQKWFGIQGSLHGNWVCVRCKKIRRHKKGIQVCKSCGNDMTYHEYSISPTKNLPISGHIDGILITDGGEVYLIDYKGSSHFAMLDLKQSGYPKESHYLQTNAYAHAVNSDLQAFGLRQKIQKIVIIYVDRGRPWRSWLPMQVPLSRRLLKEAVGRIQLAQECLKTGKVPRGLCLNPSDDNATYCPWRTLCFSPVLEELLGDQVEPETPRTGSSESDLLLLASYFEEN